MANEYFNERVLLQLPSDYTCERGIDDNGDAYFKIQKGKYINDDGETEYEFCCFVSLIEYDPLDSDNVVDGVIEFEKETENSRIVKLSETPKVYIKRLFKSFSIFGKLLYSFELSGQIRLSDCSVLNVSTRKAYTDDESIDELSIIQDFLCVLSSAFIDGRKAPLEKVSAFEIYESLKTNSSPEAKDISPKIRFNINLNGEETTYEFSSDGLKHLDDEPFERTEPDEKLYPRYNRSLHDPLASLGAVVVRNPTGTDYQFISFSKMIDDGLSDEADPVFRRIKDADKSNFSPATEAEKYKTVFRVNASAFNEKHDRECEIDEGYIQKDYMLIALRSFAWTLASYCSQYNTEPAQMSFDDFKRIADYCEKHDWLNFNNFSYCKGLCDCGDLHIYYIPDSASDSDRKFIEPSQEDYDRVESMRKAFPNYNEILSEVKSLDKLREDLTYVYPAMTAFYEKLNAERNPDKELTGSCADILYAWCAITKAAKEPFYIEDGPMNCWFTQNEAAESLGVSKDTSEKKSVTNTSAASKSPIGTSTHDGIEVVQLTEKSKGVRFNFGEFEGYDGEEVHIALPEGTDAVGFNAFNCNYSVKTVVIPEGTTKIDMDAFEFAKISCIVLPSTLDTISFNAFRWCENLKEVVLPDGLTEIGSDAFSGCSGLKYIYIPDSVFDFGMDCFDDLDDCIFHVEPGSDAEEYIRENYEDYKIVYSKPAGYGNLPEIKIISKTAVVSADGFVTIEPDDGDVDSDYDGELTRYNGDAKKIRISDEFDTIESDAFSCNDTIEQVIIPDSVTTINSNAFSLCKNLKTVVLPSNLDIISSNLFWGCANLEEVNIPDSVTEIEFDAFNGCKNLKKITIPSSVFEIDEAAFDFEQCVFYVEEGSYADEFLQELDADVSIEYI